MSGKIFKKQNLSWWIPIIILLIANIFIVYFGRIRYPDNFHAKETSFFENYWAWCLFEVTFIIVSSMIIGMIGLLVIMIHPKWNKKMHLLIFRSWNTNGYNIIKDAEKAKE